jgi:hypothetical protein
MLYRSGPRTCLVPPMRRRAVTGSRLRPHLPKFLSPTVPAALIGHVSKADCRSCLVRGGQLGARRNHGMQPHKTPQTLAKGRLICGHGPCGTCLGTAAVVWAEIHRVPRLRCSSQRPACLGRAPAGPGLHQIRAVAWQIQHPVSLGAVLSALEGDAEAFTKSNLMILFSP